MEDCLRHERQSDPGPQWVCPRCKVDRFKQPCGDPHSGQCPMVGTTTVGMAFPPPLPKEPA